MCDQSIEGRDWIGNPDGTLVYWQQECEEARHRATVAEERFSRAVVAVLDRLRSEPAVYIPPVAYDLIVREFGVLS